MKPIATARLVQAAGRYADHAPMATACCNACRTCVQTNLLTLAAGAGGAAVAAVRRLVRRGAAAAERP